MTQLHPKIHGSTFPRLRLVNIPIYGKSTVDQLDKKVLRVLVEKLNESLK